ncbi:MAG: (2Fe-2S) ferredoxin domain-containing protein [Anaerolineaceae bacterium]|nr:MAG: 2Fe-2S ferredoxin [Chloroflexi bacterium HGW-Chloroflexi-8]
MPTINSLEDLKKIREEALRKREVRNASGQKQIIVGMGTCGIAAGARDTMKAILEKIESEGLTGISVSQTGCIGLCEMEPIVQIQVGEGEKITYGKINPEKAAKIIQDHVLGGAVVKEYMITL